MRTFKTLLFGLGLLSITVPATQTIAAGFKAVYGGYSYQTYQNPLSEEEINDLIHMREEEKLARDVYITLYKKWGMKIFYNISQSEQRHMDAIKRMLDKYGLPDPVEETNDTIGVFVNPELQELYYTLVNKGEQSLIDALEVGATIEDLDIKDLEECLSETQHYDIATVYTNLMKGSRNHLRAFTRVLNRLGEEYQPQYISEEEYEYIISTPMERGFEKPQNW